MLFISVHERCSFVIETFYRPLLGVTRIHFEVHIWPSAFAAEATLVL